MFSIGLKLMAESPLAHIFIQIFRFTTSHSEVVHSALTHVPLTQLQVQYGRSFNIFDLPAMHICKVDGDKVAIDPSARRSPVILVAYVSKR